MEENCITFFILPFFQRWVCLPSFQWLQKSCVTGLFFTGFQLTNATAAFILMFLRCHGVFAWCKSVWTAASLVLTSLLFEHIWLTRMQNEFSHAEHNMNFKWEHTSYNSLTFRLYHQLCLQYPVILRCYPSTTSSHRKRFHITWNNNYIDSEHQQHCYLWLLRLNCSKSSSLHPQNWMRRRKCSMFL